MGQVSLCLGPKLGKMAYPVNLERIKTYLDQFLLEWPEASFSAFTCDLTVVVSGRIKSWETSSLITYVFLLVFYNILIITGNTNDLYTFLDQIYITSPLSKILVLVIFFVIDYLISWLASLGCKRKCRWKWIAWQKGMKLAIASS